MPEPNMSLNVSYPTAGFNSHLSPNSPALAWYDCSPGSINSNPTSLYGSLTNTPPPAYRPSEVSNSINQNDGPGVDVPNGEVAPVSYS